jgi:hypothetical protein
MEGHWTLWYGYMDILVGKRLALEAFIHLDGVGLDRKIASAC